MIEDDGVDIMSPDRKIIAQFGYRRSADQDLPGVTAHHPVVIVGAGPVGMALALDLAQRGVRVVLLDDSDRIGEGSRGICWAKRTLEIFDRLGVAAPMVEKGVVWQKGRVFLDKREIYDFDLAPEGGHKMPAFINLQQYYVERELAAALLAHGDVDLRWRNRVSGILQRNDGAIVTIETPDGPYQLSCDWLVCCDGARSECRDMLGLKFKGEAFEDRFLIADVKMTAAFPTERWFWFDPPFHSGQSALLHKQPDDVWRIDLQLGPDADVDAERQPERVRPRIERMLGHRNFELEWVSVYTFQCRRLDRFVHGRVLFAGDAAHQVSPFGARGANSGVQDAENLAWKLAAVIGGQAPAGLIESYEVERGHAADENIRHSTRSTDFIAPRTPTERAFRNAALELAVAAPFARRFVNSGRLSTSTVYDSPLSTPDDASSRFTGAARPGAVLPDAPVVRGDGQPGFLLKDGLFQKGTVSDRDTISKPGSEPGNLSQQSNGPIILFWDDGSNEDSVRACAAACGGEAVVFGRDIVDSEGLATERLCGAPGVTYVLRPDQHVAARFHEFDAEAVRRAAARAMGRLDHG